MGQVRLATPEAHHGQNSARARAQSYSLLDLLRRGLELRQVWRDFPYQKIVAPAGVWAYSRGPYRIYFNLSQEVFELPAGQVLLATRLVDSGLPPRAAVVLG